MDLRFNRVNLYIENGIIIKSDMDKEMGEIFLSPQYAVYSQPDRTQHKIPVRID